MSLVIEIFIICDGCGENFGVDSRHLTGTQQRKNARKEDWIYVANKDLCPDCRAKRKDGNYPKTKKINQ